MDLKKAAAKEKETAVYFFEFLRTLVPEFYTRGQSQTKGQTQSALVVVTRGDYRAHLPASQPASQTNPLRV